MNRDSHVIPLGDRTVKSPCFQARLTLHLQDGRRYSEDGGFWGCELKEALEPYAVK